METQKQVSEISKWTLDPAHSELMFRVRHLMISNVKGEFRDFQVNLESAGDDIRSSKLEVTVNADSISTNNTDRDNHLKSNDFFDVEKYPELKFESGTTEKTGEKQYKLTGYLTIRGVRREIVLDVESGGYMKDPYGNEKSGYSVSGKINRRDFGLNWNAALEAGGVMVGDEVHINAEVQLIRHKSQAAV